MADEKQFMFTHKEVVEALIKRQGLHEGLWALTVEFGIGAATAGTLPDSVYPTAMVPVLKLGLNQATDPSNLTVDAAEVNPAKPAKKPKKK